MAGLTLNQIYGIPDGVDPNEWYRSQYSEQTGMQTAIPGGMDPSNRSMLAQLLNGTLTGDYTSLGQFGAPGGSINDAALNEALQKRYGTTNVLSRFTDDTPGWVTGRGTMTRELYAANPDGTYRPTGDKLATENDATSDLITSISMIAPFVGGQIASAYGAAGTGAGASSTAAGDALLAAEMGANAYAPVGSAGYGAAAGGIGTLESIGLTPLTTPTTFAPMELIGGAGAAGAAGAMGGAGGSGVGTMEAISLTPTTTASTVAPMSTISGTGGGLLDTLGKALTGSGSLTDWGKLAMTAAGAYQGSKGSDGTSASTTKEMDPRMAAMFYGTGLGDPNSIAGAAMNWWQQNKSGQNDTMRQGMDMQRAAYTDQTAVNNLRSIASALGSGGVAANPFTSGQQPSPLMQAVAPQRSATPGGYLQNAMSPETELQRRMRAQPSRRMY